MKSKRFNQSASTAIKQALALLNKTLRNKKAVFCSLAKSLVTKKPFFVTKHIGRLKTAHGQQR